MITETQVGAIGENLVATQLMIESSGRLAPFKPVADDAGIDLLVYDKKTGRAVPVQVKCRTKTLNRHPKNVHFQVRDATFKAEQDGYLLAAYLNTKGSTWYIERAWLVPMGELEDICRKQGDKLVIRPSISTTSGDKYSEHRCADMGDVASRLLDALDGH